MLHPESYFLPKVISSFHQSQCTVLPTFFPEPADKVQWALRTLDFGERCPFISQELVHSSRTLTALGPMAVLKNVTGFPPNGKQNGSCFPSPFAMNLLSNPYLYSHGLIPPGLCLLHQLSLLDCLWMTSVLWPPDPHTRLSSHITPLTSEPNAMLPLDRPS